MTTLTILKVDDPQIGIEFDLTHQPVFEGECIAPFRLMHPAKTARRVIRLHLALWGGTKECARSIKTIEPNEDGASLGGAAFAQNGKGTFNLGAP